MFYTTPGSVGEFAAPPHVVDKPGVADGFTAESRGGHAGMAQEALDGGQADHEAGSPSGAV
ncbi:hypothetical protein SLG_36480 [Sphingobium sp. SYK-6]|nr:hypothetical protein SLG_36480 [Sphingobium sp. SYK-6]